MLLLYHSEPCSFLLLPFFTKNGSFWTGDLKKTLKTYALTEIKKNYCIFKIDNIYNSIAIIPIKVGNQRIGILQLLCRKKNFFTKYAVYQDLRRKGYIVKTALKFGAEFRVYENGKKPGQAHAIWIVFPVYETSGLTWHEFSAKTRVAHSTRKNLLIAIVDEEGDVTYYEVAWKKP